jgi:histidinol phosphatase-like enzyme
MSYYFHNYEDFNIDPSRSWMIGDSPAYMSAGKNVGCKTIMIGILCSCKEQ